MTNTNWLARFLRWMFTVFTVVMAIAAIALALVLMIDPSIPADAQIGPLEIELMDQKGTIVLRDSTLFASMLRGGITLRVDNATGMLELLKHFGLPLALLYAAFFAVLFDLLRRLFRNVGKGQSFTHNNVRLVQIIGLSLITFSFVASIAEGWFHFAVFTYLAQHAVITVSGTPIHLPAPAGFEMAGGGGFPFGSPYFFSGLLVLALSEVFRQGLVLQRENDLTV